MTNLTEGINRWLRSRQGKWITKGTAVLVGALLTAIVTPLGERIVDGADSWLRIGPGEPTCHPEPVRGFGKVWSEQPMVRLALGCPTSVERAVEKYTAQRFQKGMLLLNDQRTSADEQLSLNAMIEPGVAKQSLPFSLPFIGTKAERGTLVTVPDHWHEWMPEPVPLTAPAGLVAPRGRLGMAWRDGPSLRERLGWAIEPEIIGASWSLNPQDRRNAAMQDFERGFMFWAPFRAGSADYELDRWIFVVVTAGMDGGPKAEWFKFPDTWTEIPSR